MVQDVEFLRIKKHALLHVADEGIVRPTVPQARDHLVELARARVTVGMRQMGFPIEVECLVRIRRGHQVPPRTTIAQVIQRGEFARHVVGIVVGR